MMMVELVLGTSSIPLIKNEIKEKEDYMKRFSISFNDGEYRKLEEIRDWYEEETGVKVSKCAMIKRLLFDPDHKVVLKQPKASSK
jgi:hypothetical protein